MIRINNFISPLVSLILFSVSIGFLTTFITFLMNQKGINPILIGSMSTFNYIGVMIGAFKSEKVILRIGHIRAFCAFGSVMSIITLLHGVIDNTYIWFVLRFIIGVCLSGLYVVIESWLLSVSSIKNRGSVLALYMIALYGAQAVGQLFMLADLNQPINLFLLAGICCIASIFPLSITRIPSPKIEEAVTLDFKVLVQKTPSGIISSFSSGLILGSLYGLLPIYLAQLNYSKTMIGYMMFATIFGGMALQYPLGKLSDIIERRTVIATLFFTSAFLLSCLIFFPINPAICMLLFFVLGGLTFAIYPISISHACDTISANSIVSATQGLLLIYSVGAALGPLLSGVFVFYNPNQGLILFLLLVSIPTGCYLSYVRAHSKASPQDDAFMPHPQTTIVVSEIDPRIEDPN
ncbi:MAG TPA: MFS transporter [Holosporales bacterium]|nr:MFS transporter [Holosporales bacterium]